MWTVFTPIQQTEYIAILRKSFCKEKIPVKSFLTDKDVANSSDNDFDYTVSSDLWNKVLEAIKDENEDELKFCLQDVDEYIQKRGLAYL